PDRAPASSHSGQRTALPSVIHPAHLTPATPLNSAIHPALVADDQEWIMNSLPSTIQADGRLASRASKSSIEYVDDHVWKSMVSLQAPGPARQVANPLAAPRPKGKGKHRAFNQLVRESPLPSPTRKRTPLPLPPLTDAGRRMAITEFLIHCNINEYDSTSHSLIDGHCIKHWCFFRGQSADDLMRIGFRAGWRHKYTTVC
ncbi:hypothetical protein H4Q26_015592, partial [Puccinia striiformis f. sp. tritici PST-130]